MNGAAAHLVMELEEKLVELEGLQGERSQSSSRSGGHVESERINSNRTFETGNQHLTCFTGTVSRYQHTHTVSLINSWFIALVTGAGHTTAAPSFCVGPGNHGNIAASTLQQPSAALIKKKTHTQRPRSHFSVLAVTRDVCIVR